MSGGDHIHTGTVVGKLEGERGITMGFVDLLRENYVEQDFLAVLLHPRLGFYAWCDGSSLWWYSRLAHARTRRNLR